MSEELEALRAGILAQPGDTDLWKVYADWLEERGHPACDGIRAFILCVEGKEREIACYIRLESLPPAENDLGHAAFFGKAGGRAAAPAICVVLGNHARGMVDSDDFLAIEGAAMGSWVIAQIVPVHRVKAEGMLAS